MPDTDNYIGEVRMFGGNFAPVGWLLCDGSKIPISQFDTLFSLIGTTYGGDGQSTFGLPDLRGRIPIHQGNGFILAETGGAEEITLTVNQIAVHSHPALATSSLASDGSPANQVLAESRPGSLGYFGDVPAVNMAATAISSVGGNQPHT